MIYRLFLACVCLTIAGCSAASTAKTTLGPRGGTISSQGFATILEAPAAPFTPILPDGPSPLTPTQVEGNNRFSRTATFQNEVRSQVDALRERLDKVENGNFAGLYFDNKVEPSVVFQFIRNGPGTIRKYTSDPRFRGETVRWTREQLRADVDWFVRTFRNDRAFTSVGIGASDIEARVAISQAEWRTLVKKKGVVVPESIRLIFPDRLPANLNTPLPPAIASMVRIFPRSDREVGAVEAILSRAKVVLRDGCFRIPEKGDALVLFPLGAQLFVDPEGYLAFGSAPTAGYARVGEDVDTPGVIHEITTPDLVEPIHRACGSGPVVRLNGLASVAAHRKQDQVSENWNSRQQFIKTYGLSAAQADLALQKCKQAMGFGICIMSPPPPPLPNMTQAQCPTGSKLRAGICRTPEGFIRPLPPWLIALLR